MLLSSGCVLAAQLRALDVTGSWRGDLRGGSDRGEARCGGVRDGAAGHAGAVREDRRLREPRRLHVVMVVTVHGSRVLLKCWVADCEG